MKPVKLQGWFIFYRRGNPTDYVTSWIKDATAYEAVADCFPQHNFSDVEIVPAPWLGE